MLIDWVNGQLPANEEIGRALREDVRMYPEIAIREISGNMIIHQDFSVLGFPMIEIYSDRVEIFSPCQPLINLIVSLTNISPEMRNWLTLCVAWASVRKRKRYG